MENILSFPRQFRGPDTRPEETLRTLETSCGTTQHSFEFLCPFRGTIGQSALRLSPYKFHRVKLRGISREPFHMEPWITTAEVMDGLSPMNKGSVP